MTPNICDIEFTKNGSIYQPEHLTTVLNACDGAPLLVVLVHGWNNDMADAHRLYQRWLTSLKKVGADGTDLLEHMTVLQVFWPSKKFALEHLIAGGGAASLSDTAAIRESLQALNHDPTRLGDSEEDSWSPELEEAMGLVEELEHSPQARHDFVAQIRKILDPEEAHADDASVEFFAASAEELFHQFGESVAPKPVVEEGGATGGLGAAARIAPAGGAVGLGSAAGLGGAIDPGGAAFLGGALSKIKTGAVRIANYATYYQMKSRAGTVGRTGLAQVLDQVRIRYPALPIHLVGHSFGARVVVAAAARMHSGGAPVSLSLVQGAFSHNGLAEKFDGTHNGAFRTVLADHRVSGPIIITHTKNDQAVGIAYPLASRIAQDNSAALGDENDPYGGMGRNGAQHTPEVAVSEAQLRPWNATAHYQFEPGNVYNLRADQSIKDHNDVTGVDVACAMWQVLRGSVVS